MLETSGLKPTAAANDEIYNGPLDAVSIRQSKNTAWPHKTIIPMKMEYLDVVGDKRGWLLIFNAKMGDGDVELGRITSIGLKDRIYILEK